MKLRRDRVIEELKLLAAGANGCEVEPDEDQFPTLQYCLCPEALARFADAVKGRWFTNPQTNGYEETFGLFEIGDIAHWATFDTLADAILGERKRIDRAKASQP